MSKCVTCSMPNEYNDMIGENTMKKVLLYGLVRCDEECKTYICNFCITTQYKKDGVFILGHNPKCKTECLYCNAKLFSNGSRGMMCSNSCGTFFCNNCNGKLYVDKKTNDINKGHSPTCGIF